MSRFLCELTKMAIMIPLLSQEASQRAHIHFVPVKSGRQQEISCLHRRLERLIKNKTAVSIKIRGLLSKFGVVFPCGTNLVGQPLWDNLCGNAALLIGVQGVLDNAQYSVRLPDKMTDRQEECKIY
jgi:hypothetical protein